MLLHTLTGVLFPNRKSAQIVMSRYNYYKAIKDGTLVWIDDSKKVENINNYIKRLLLLY